jgi:hypothetical protein
VSDKTVTTKLRGIKITTHGDLIDLGILSENYIIVTELTVKQAEEMEDALREAREAIARDA